MKWDNRIVGSGYEAPDQLLANPSNHRIHPHSQQAALGAALDEIGWVQRVIVNRRTGFVVDGHLRVAMAISSGAKTVPVSYVDLDPEEEQLAVAAFDAITNLAMKSDSAFDMLVESLDIESEALQLVVDGVANSGNVDLGDPFGRDDERKDSKTLLVKIGSKLSFPISDTVYLNWRENIMKTCDYDERRCAAEIMVRLGIAK